MEVFKIDNSNEFRRKNYDTISVFIKKNTKDTLKEIAKINNESLNEYIKKAVQQRYFDDVGAEIEL